MITRFKWLDTVLAAELPDGVKVVASYLFNRANGELTCHPRQDTAAAATGRSRRSVIRAIQQLTDAGFLEIERDGCTAVNTYKLTLPSDTRVTSDVTPVSHGEVTPVSPAKCQPCHLRSDTAVTSSKQTREQTREQQQHAADEAPMTGLAKILAEFGCRGWHFMQVENIEGEWRLKDPVGWEEALRGAVRDRLEHRDKTVRWWMTALRAALADHQPTTQRKAVHAGDKVEVFR